MILFLSALGIFFLRILDVSVGTLRIGMLMRGRRTLAGVCSFVESLIWLAAAAQVLTNLDNPAKFIAYAGGYAVGTMLGSTFERWIALGDTLLRVVSPVGSPSLVEPLRHEGYFVTVVNGEGRDGDVKICFTVVPRRKVNKVLEVIEQVNPRAFITSEDTNPVRLTAFPAATLRK